VLLERPQVSISSTFSGPIFWRYFSAKNYKAETFGFVIFWRQNIGKKAACKMLLTLTAGVNFIDI